MMRMVWMVLILATLVTAKPKPKGMGCNSGCMLHQILGGFYEQSQLSEQSCQSEQSQHFFLFYS